MIHTLIHSLLRRLNDRLIRQKTYDENERHKITKIYERHGLVRFKGKPRKGDTRLIFESFPQFELHGVTQEEIQHLKKEFIPLVWSQDDEFYRTLERILMRKNIFNK